MIENLLSRLEKVRPVSRNAWTACCPAHNDDKPSLAVREVETGQILIHCFAGCSVDQILDSLGMDITELFPDEQKNLQPLKKKFFPMAVLQLVRHEVVIVGLAAIDLKNGKALSPEDQDRLLVAIGRIQEAVDYAS